MRLEIIACKYTFFIQSRHCLPSFYVLPEIKRTAVDLQSCRELVFLWKITGVIL